MMMHMPWVVAMLMLFFILVAGGVYVTARAIGAHQVDEDHPAKKAVTPS